MTVPVLSVVFMFVSLVLSIGTPIALFLLLRRKFALKVIPSLVGAAAFIVFAMILERLLHAAVLAPNASGEIVLMTYPYLYAFRGNGEVHLIDIPKEKIYRIWYGALLRDWARWRRSGFDFRPCND